MIPITLVHQRPGGNAVELTTVQSGVTFDTAAVGGFGSLSATLPGDLRKQLSYLGRVRAIYATTLLWEGQLEDQSVRYNAASQETTFRAFGLKRKLEETSVRRFWSKRDIGWLEWPVGPGGVTVNGNTKADMGCFVGQFDPSDLSKSGVRVTGNNAAVGGGSSVGQVAFVKLPTGLSAVRIMGTVALAGGNTGVGKIGGQLLYSATGADPYSGASFTASGSIDQVITGATVIALGAYNFGGALTPTGADMIDFYNIRILGTSVTEDASGGFYGGTILRDLVSLIPGLSLGLVEDGSDFTIQSIERAVRDASLSVLQEVAGYYTREWAVWEDGRFDWKTRNLDEAQWIVKIADTTELEIDTSTDDLARTVYVLYTDAASDLDAEASASATDQRNPYVRQGIAKDVLLSPGFPMTSNTSGQLATRIVGDIGRRPSASGRIVLPANHVVQSAVGPSRVAALIRGGDNVLLPELPKSDIFITGRDGETLFHVAASSVDLDKNEVTLELEGQQQRTDVILARLAAVTRTLTG